MKKIITVLLVDDDDDDRNLFFEAVREFDNDITGVGLSNGTDAIDYLKNENNSVPDFIFLDLRMNGLSGQKCLEEIKSDDRLKSIPVIVYTTSKDVDESIKLKKLGAAHFMSKPTSPEEIYFMISVVLNENWS